MARMKKLNPGKMVMMVVDRIHLVYQQSSAIVEDVGLNLCGVCGDTVSAYLKNKIIDGQYDGVVCTAGSMHDILTKKELYIHQFSVIVFDECHHGSIDNDHKYTKILEIIGRFWTAHPECTPRLLGLSASPVKATSIGIATRNLHKLQDLFCSALLYLPTVKKEASGQSWHVVRESEKQQEVNKECYATIRKTFKKLADACGESMDMYFDERRSSWGQFIGAARRHYRLPTEKYANIIEKNVNALQINELLGPYYTEQFTKSDSETCTNRFLITDISSQLEKLENILLKLPPTSRVLIFIDTKFAALHLQKRLCGTIRHLPCGTVVGMGGWDGMTGPKQKHMLEQFRDGVFKILIATSVLDEGKLSKKWGGGRLLMVGS